MNVTIGQSTMRELRKLGMPLERIAALAICTWSFAKFVTGAVKREYVGYPIFTDAQQIQSMGFSREAAEAYLTEPKNTPHMKAVNSRLIEELVEAGVGTTEIQRSLGCSAKLIQVARKKMKIEVTNV